MPADLGFIGNLNELVQDYFSTTNLTETKASFDASNEDWWSYIYGNLIKTKGPDMIKLSNLQNYLSEWDRPYSYGGFLRSVTIGPVKPMDPPTFTNGSDPNNGMIRKAEIDATYHKFKVRLEFFVTQFADQLKDAMSVPDEIALYVAGVLQSLNDGANDTLYRLYKEVIYKYYSTLPTDVRTALTDTTLPDITDKASAIAAVNAIRNYKTSFMFGHADYNSSGFPHTVTPDRQRLYVRDEYANAMVDYLKLDHYMGDVDYSNVAGSLSQFLGIPIKILDDFGGMIPYGVPTGDPATAARLYPIFDSQGAITGTYSETQGGTTGVPVGSWQEPTDYQIKALLTEDDFGNVFPINDGIRTMYFIRGGGYTNTSRYIERLLVAKPQSNTVFFA